jgi:hypothetical protein
MAKSEMKPATAPAQIPPSADESAAQISIGETPDQAPAPDVAPAPDQAPEATTMAMVRDQPTFEGGPVTADVHPNEVDAMYGYGWRLAGK